MAEFAGLRLRAGSLDRLEAHADVSTWRDRARVLVIIRFIGAGDDNHRGSVVHRPILRLKRVGRLRLLISIQETIEPVALPVETLN